MLTEDVAGSNEYLFAGLMGPSRLGVEELPPELKDKICEEASVSVADALLLVSKTWQRHADRRLFRDVVLASKKGLDNWKRLEECRRVEGLPRVVVVHREVSGGLLDELWQIENVRQNVRRVIIQELTSGLISSVLDMISSVERLSKVQLGMTWGVWPGTLVVLQRLSEVEKLDALAVEGFRAGEKGKWEVQAPLRLARLAIPYGGRGMSSTSLGELLHSGWLSTSTLRFLSITLKQRWGDEVLEGLLDGMGGLSELEIDARGER